MHAECHARRKAVRPCARCVCATRSSLVARSRVPREAHLGRYSLNSDGTPVMRSYSTTCGCTGSEDAMGAARPLPKPAL